ncbi:helix-turn-helix domain-containing protein [Nonomuraea guangzhouensis]|uniref:Scr1 family TA system antitoxin-like transcriptional regulator n=1 Tax=Nonomuraea guangzhouensis TaxID=1291555 RepID=A0ABW4GMB3_9ACTN|nr:helix-turn-helix transcriptional regulator [Nonomuraea guangzhouensis]
MANDLDPRLTAAQRFGKELARVRKEANMTQIRLGKHLGCSSSLIAHLEKGDRTPKLDLAAGCDEIFGTGDRFKRLCRNITSPTGPDWYIRWTEEIEPYARVLRSWDPLQIPGILQTEAYARAVFRGGLFTSEQDIQDKVDARMRRRGILLRDKSPTLLVLLDEWVLRRPIDGAKVMEEQLDYLLTAGELPNVTIQIVPYDTTCTTGLMSAFMIAELSDAPTTVSVDSAAKAEVSADHKLVSLIWDIYDKLRTEALRPGPSLQMIKEARNQWKQQT